MTQLLEIVKPYLKRYWWVALVALALTFVDRLGGVIESYYAYKHPQTKLIVVTKTIKQKDVVHTREVIVQPDGTRIERERTEDKSSESSDSSRKEDAKPVLATSRLFSQTISVGYLLEESSIDVGYTLRYKNVSVGVSAPVADELKPKLTASLSF